MNTQSRAEIGCLIYQLAKTREKPSDALIVLATAAAGVIASALSKSGRSEAIALQCVDFFADVTREAVIKCIKDLEHPTQ